MFLVEDDKVVQFDVEGYQFPNADDYYDKNWLTIKVNYETYYAKDVYLNSCLLTYELRDFINDIATVFKWRKIFCRNR